MKRWYGRRYWIYGTLGLLLLLDVVLYLGWIRQPLLLGGVAPGELAGAAEEVGAREAEVRRLKRVQEMLPGLRPQLQSFLSERFLDESSGFSRVVSDLGEAAADTGVELTSVSYDRKEMEEQPDLVRIEITAQLEGGYGSLLGYLEELERSERFYLINTLSVIGSQGGRLRLQMQLQTYFRRGV